MKGVSLCKLSSSSNHSLSCLHMSISLSPIVPLLPFCLMGLDHFSHVYFSWAFCSEPLGWNVRLVDVGCQPTLNDGSLSGSSFSLAPFGIIYEGAYGPPTLLSGMTVSTTGSHWSGLGVLLEQAAQPLV